MEQPRTLPLTKSDASDGQSTVSLLIRIGQCHRPLAPFPLVLDLEPLEQLRLGRGEAEELRQQGEGTMLRLDDPWMSGRHALVERYRTAERPLYTLEDQKSTNGCYVNGRKVKRCELKHGDIVETGQTFFKFYQGPVDDLEALLRRAYSSGEITPRATVCPQLLDIFGRLKQIAPTEIPVILLGESGTGKEVMTNQIHALSGRGGDSVALNCAAIPEGLIESELFGHRKGAFTGASSDRQGMVEAAHRGTLLLDEIGDMPLAAQAKVLRVLQERKFVRLGETRAREADVRFIAATHQDLEQMVEQGTFRGDLFARLNGFCLRLPALRERKEDLGILMAHFLGRNPRVADLTLGHEAMRALLLYRWPFNIRELEKCLETAVALAGDSRKITPTHLPDAVRRALEVDEPAPARPPGVEPGASDDEIRAVLDKALTDNKGNVSAVSRELGHTRMQIHRWMKRLGMDVESYRS